MLELGGCFGFLLLAVDVIAIIKTWTSRATTGVKVVWTVVIFFLPVLGLILWLLFGPKGPLRT